MAVTHELVVGTNDSAEKFVNKMCNSTGYDVNIRSEENHGQVFFNFDISIFFIEAEKISPRGWGRGDLENHFTFSTGFSILFTPRDDDIYNVQSELIKLAINTIRQSQDIELVLYFEHGDELVLTYKQEEGLILNSLSINSPFNIWDRRRLDLITIPYKFKEISVF